MIDQDYWDGFKRWAAANAPELAKPDYYDPQGKFISFRWFAGREDFWFYFRRGTEENINAPALTVGVVIKKNDLAMKFAEHMRPEMLSQLTGLPIRRIQNPRSFVLAHSADGHSQTDELPEKQYEWFASHARRAQPRFRDTLEYWMVWLAAMNPHLSR